jgi:hypothetical protein
LIPVLLISSCTMQKDMPTTQQEATQDLQNKHA